jgi:putative ABC transport system permease protein
MTLLVATLAIGLVLATLALGSYLSYRVLNMPDVTVDGSLPLGAATAAALIVNGHSPFVATVAGFLAGAAAGVTTAFLHMKLSIEALLAGILVMTGLYSVNLRVMGKSNVSLAGEDSVFTPLAGWFERLAGSPRTTLLGRPVGTEDLAALVTALLFVAAVSIAIWWLLRTEFGGLLRATGENQRMVRALGGNVGFTVGFGLAISNGLAGLSGALLAQMQGFADAQMGIGMIVVGLASVIIGLTLVGESSIGVTLVGVTLGSIIFRLLVALALRAGLEANDLKLITAVFVLVAIALPRFLGKGHVRGEARRA